jgi:cysteinyl-tRNA synthetase
MIKLYNTLTRNVEEFKPIHKEWVGFYSCGPTVYDYAHIGHARTYIFADTLQRVLEFAGYKVKRVMNITDVGHLTSDSDSGQDKMEKGAAREHKSVWDIAKFYTDDFFAMTDVLNIKRPSIICKATDYIPGMISLIQTLEKKGCTYVIGDGVYFDTTTLKDYGKLTGTSFKELQKGLKAGARIEMVTGKKNPTDFALWKLTPKGTKRQMEWVSPWGRGFPGWHIECSAMSMAKLGETIDIHTGGIDHVQIHHTNEIAQSEAATGNPFVRYWLHADHLMVDGQKMSKSLGNFYRVKDIVEKGHNPLTLRYLFLTSSYRTTMNFTWKSLEGAQTSLKNLYQRIEQVAKRDDSDEKTNPQLVAEFKQSFEDAIYDDLNIPKALSVVWMMLKSKLSRNDTMNLLELFDSVLALDLIKNHSSESKLEAVDEHIETLVKKRDTYRLEKKWDKSDEIRHLLEEKGYVVSDTKSGTVIKKKE